MPTIFAGDYDGLPDYEITTRVKLPGPDMWDTKTIEDAIDMIDKMLQLAARTASVLLIASGSLGRDTKSLLQLTYMEAHLGEIERTLRSAHECACKITQKSILESWPDSPPEVKSEIKETVLKILNGPEMTDEGKEKLQKKFKEVLEYEP